MKTSRLSVRFADALALALLAVACSGCSPRAGDATAADSASADRGATLIAAVGCGSCHTVPGVRGANGLVGPPLSSFARRTYIAGHLPNTRDNLVRWLEDPPAIDPGTAMPALGLSGPQAHDIATYLETLR